jgi:hypothetical protein
MARRIPPPGTRFALFPLKKMEPLKLALIPFLFILAVPASAKSAEIRQCEAALAHPTGSEAALFALIYDSFHSSKTSSDRPFIYQPKYCVENVSRLLNRIENHGFDLSRFAVLILFREMVAMLGLPPVEQNLIPAHARAGSVAWSFHVVVVDRQTSSIIDLDYTSKPVDKTAYFLAMFPQNNSTDRYRNMPVRLVPAAQYLQSFTKYTAGTANYYLTGSADGLPMSTVHDFLETDH